MNNDNIQKLEIISQFKNKYSEWVNPELLSLKYCQTKIDAFLEITFSKEPDSPEIINPDFIADEFDPDNVEEIPALFRPDADVVDNAKTFVEFDTYSLIMCVDGLFTKDAEEIINSNHLKNIS